MKLFIDAFNIKVGGGLTHLKELLANAQPEVYGFSQVKVFAPSTTLQQLPEMPWLVKEYVLALNKSCLRVWFWRTIQLRRIVKKSRGILFIPGSGSSSVTFVTMCQNLLPVQKAEMNRYKGTNVWWRLVLLRWLHRYSYQKAAGVIFLNEYCQVAVERDMNVTPKFSVIIPHGINYRFMRKKASYAFRDAFKLVYVSIIDEYKHQWKVAEAVYQLNKEGYVVELYLVGSEYSRSRKRLNMIQKANPNMNQVKLIGKVEYDSLKDIYMEMDAAIYASTCETFGMTLLEAMASSLPIACSYHSSMPEMLQDAGLYFDPLDTQSIRKVILTLIQDEILRKELGEKAYSYALKYKWEETARQTFQVLQKIANKCVE